MNETTGGFHTTSHGQPHTNPKRQRGPPRTNPNPSPTPTRSASEAPRTNPKPQPHTNPKRQRGPPKRSASLALRVSIEHKPSPSSTFHKSLHRNALRQHSQCRSLSCSVSHLEVLTLGVIYRTSQTASLNMPVTIFAVLVYNSCPTLTRSTSEATPKQPKPQPLTIRFSGFLPTGIGEGLETNNGVVLLRVAIDPDLGAVLVNGVENFRALDPLRRRPCPWLITTPQTSQKLLVCGGEFISKERVASGIRLRI